MFNKGDGVLVIMQNGYASATGQQYLPSSNAHRAGAPTGVSIEKTLRALGVKWLRTVRSYSVAKMAATLKQAMQSAERGLKVIIADGECMLVRQRRIRIEQAEQLKRGARVVKSRYGVDDELCTGDHSCIRLSGCPSLTVKPNPRSAAQRSGRHRDRKLRRLRLVRRGRPCRSAVPVVLSRRHRHQSELVGSDAREDTKSGDCLVERRQRISLAAGYLGRRRLFLGAAE
jgi:hypothetical protein